MAYNWKKAEAWRKHPLLTGGTRVMFPGLGIGFGAFVVYVAYDKLTGSSSHGH